MIYTWDLILQHFIWKSKIQQISRPIRCILCCFWVKFSPRLLCEIIERFRSRLGYLVGILRTEVCSLAYSSWILFELNSNTFRMYLVFPTTHIYHQSNQRISHLSRCCPLLRNLDAQMSYFWPRPNLIQAGSILCKVGYNFIMNSS